MHRRIPSSASLLRILFFSVLTFSAGWQPVDCAQTPSSHWSFQSVQGRRIPDGSGSSTIDPFVKHVLQSQELRFANPASKSEWLRRVSFNLVGLPPTPAALNAFVQDNSPDAKAMAVDRLLGSPGFGERFGQMWLDLARYADTHGYHTDSGREMWLYRDWVIAAFNENMPIDQFLQRQIAGDLLPNSTVADRVATGFLRNHMINSEEGIIPEEYRREYIADRVNTFATVLLGQTMECARCHDHKYEPFTQREYYQLAAFFDRVPEEGNDGRYGNAAPVVAAPPRSWLTRWRKLNSEKRVITNQLAELEAEHRKELDTAIEQIRSRLPSIGKRSVLLPLEESSPSPHLWQVTDEIYWGNGLHGDAAIFSGKSALTTNLDGVSLSQDWTLELLVKVRRQESGSLCRIEDTRHQFAVRLDDNVPRILWHDTGKLRAFSGSKAISTDWQSIIVTYSNKHDEQIAKIPFRLAVAGVTLELEEVAPTRIETEHWKNWFSQREDPPPLKEAIEENKTQIHLGGPSGVEDAFRGLIDDVLIINEAVGEEACKQLAMLPSTNRLLYSTQPELQQQARLLLLAEQSGQAKSFLEKLEQQEDALESASRDFPSTMVMKDGPLRPSYLLERGDYREKGEPVIADTPRVLPQLQKRGEFADRLDLARWLVADENPLTARVFVNHVWQLLWGKGLVATSEDFGLRGKSPSHPQLLDHLASEFVQRDWDLKWLVREIVLSDCYGQTAEVSADRRQTDPDNVLLSRAPRRQVTAEALRDSALFAAGLLDDQLGGPPVRPYQPAGLWKEIAYDPRQFSAQVFEQSSGGDLARRSIYTFIKRNSPPPPLEIFDAPSRSLTCTRRSSADTPQQSLVLMNETGRLEAAKFLAAKLLANPYGLLRPEHQDRQRLKDGFQLVASRLPSDQELNVLQGSLATFRRKYADDPRAAITLLEVGDIQNVRVLPPQEHAAWTMVGNVLLSLDAAISY